MAGRQTLSGPHFRALAGIHGGLNDGVPRDIGPDRDDNKNVGNVLMHGSIHWGARAEVKKLRL